MEEGSGADARTASVLPPLLPLRESHILLQRAPRCVAYLTWRLPLPQVRRKLLSATHFPVVERVRNVTFRTGTLFGDPAETCLMDERRPEHLTIYSAGVILKLKRVSTNTHTHE